MTHVKVCCIQSVLEAEIAARSGASAIGLVSKMPSGPGPISEELIADIAARKPAGVTTVLLTAERTAQAIIEQHRRCKTDALQLVDRLKGQALSELRSALPDVALFQVVHVTDASSVGEAVDAAQLADVILLDSGRPDAEIKELGGTGRVHDWSLSREVVEAVDVPVYLAGGLRAENVAAAVRAVRPYGVDLCTGVRSAGLLDADKLGAFMQQVRSA